MRIGKTGSALSVPPGYREQGMPVIYHPLLCSGKHEFITYFVNLMGPVTTHLTLRPIINTDAASSRTAIGYLMAIPRLRNGHSVLADRLIGY
jgi:hypothetical protein